MMDAIGRNRTPFPSLTTSLWSLLPLSVALGLFNTSVVAQPFAYVANAEFTSAGLVIVIDTHTNTIIDTIAAGLSPMNVTITPDGTRAYVPDPGGDYHGTSTVQVIDTASHTVLDVIAAGLGLVPVDVVFTPDGSRAYVANSLTATGQPGGGTISVVDTATNTVIGTISGLGEQIEALAITPDGSRIYVPDQNSPLVKVIDTATDTIIDTIEANRGVQFRGIAVTPDGARVYLAAGNVYVIHTATNTVVGTITGLSFPTGIAITPDGSRVYVAEFNSGEVSVIDTATNTIIAAIPVGLRAWGIAFTPDGGRAYVTRYQGDTSVIDTTSNTVIATIGTGGIGVAIASTVPSGPVQVSIDIKPGSYPNSINLGSSGVVPVAILSSPTFDATQVNPATVTLGGARVKLIGKGGKYACSTQDVNGDELPDLVCHVVTGLFLIEPGATMAELVAETFNGTRVRGEDSIRIVPE